MAIIRFTDRPFTKNPWAEFEKMKREMEEQFHTIKDGQYGFAETTVFPPLNIYEDEEGITVIAEIAGVSPADLNIALEGETLSISGERKDASGTSKASYHRREIQLGTFSRAISLPTKVNPAAITAKANNGILTIHLPKAEEVKPKKIEVKAI